MIQKSEISLKYLNEKNALSEAVAALNSDRSEKLFPGRGSALYGIAINKHLSDKGSLSRTVPWLLSDYCGLQATDHLEVISLWEAIVLYAREIDSAADATNSGRQDPTHVLFCSTLFADSLVKISSVSANARGFDFAPLFDAARNQLADYELKPSAYDRSKPRNVYSLLDVLAGKNHIVCLLGDYFSSFSEVETSDIDDFLRNLCVFAQLVDDLKDIWEDFDNEDFSIFGDSFAELRMGQETVLEADVYEFLIRDGSIEKIIHICFDHVGRIISDIDARVNFSEGQHAQQLIHLREYLVHLKSQLLEISEELGNYDENSIYSPGFINVIKEKTHGILMGT